MERRDDEKYYYEIHQENKQRYVSLFNIKRAKKFQSTKNAKMHLKKLVDECVNINKTSGFKIVEIDEQYNIISEENVSIQKLSE